MSATITSPPKFNGESFTCPRCGAFSGQTWQQLVLSDGSYHASDSRDDEVETRWYFSTCQSCKRSSVWRDETLVYPQLSLSPLPAADMPPQVRELYDEAAAVLGVSKRAGAALARAALERLLKSLYPEAHSKTRLDDYIALASADVSSSLAKLLTALRHIGNKTLHGSNDPDESVTLFLSVDEGVVELLFAAINDLVDERITKPAEADRIWSLLPVGVREEAERKAAKSQAAG